MLKSYKPSLQLFAVFLFTMFVAILSVLALSLPAQACDVAVISAKASANGRPIIWKNFDCSSYWHTEILRKDSISATAGASYFIYHNDDYMTVLNGSPFTDQAGCNEKGFAMANAEVPESYNATHESLNLNTDLVMDAVQNCATLSDFENYVKEWPAGHPGGVISGNFVALDGQGGAALYEIYTGSVNAPIGNMPIVYTKYDANNGEVTDSEGNVIQAPQNNWCGYWNRTNFNNYVPYIEGQDRYNRGCTILAQLAAANELSPEHVMRDLSKDVNGLQNTDYSGPTSYSTTYCISRNATRSGTVIEGVASGDNPALTTMWNALGEPSISVYVPTIVGAGRVADYAHYDSIALDGTMTDADDSSLLEQAEDDRETCDKMIYSSNRGNAATAMDDKTIDKNELARVQAWTFPIEATVVAKTNSLLNNCRADSSLINPANLFDFCNYVSKYVYQSYTDAFYKPEPWNYSIPQAKSPTATISYSTKSTTSGKVVATLVPDQDVTVTNNNGSKTYTFTENGSFTFQFQDASGNTGSATAAVTWITNDKVTATVSYSTTSKTTGSVVATLVPSKTVTVTNNGGSATYTFTENGSFTFQFCDAEGNTGSATAKVTWITPSATIAYSPASATAGSVVATLVSAQPVTVTNNLGSTTYTFIQNGSFTFQFQDATGNIGSATADVTWIDRTPPTATITYSPSANTSGSVVATLVPSENVTVTNNAGSRNFTFTQNGSFTFQFQDAAGNVGLATATVTWIKNSAPLATVPTATISYSPSTATSGSVVATLVPDQDVTVNNNNGSKTYTFTQNGLFTFQFTNSAGLSGLATAAVTWIKSTTPLPTIPTATISYSTTELTNGNVVATLLPDQDVTVTNNNGSKTYTFTQNGSFTFQFTNSAGLSGLATATVIWIDKTTPTATILYSLITPTKGSVVATLLPSEIVTVTNNGGSTSYTFTKNGSFTFQYRDAAGNTGAATAAVTWITSSSGSGSSSTDLFSWWPF